MQQMKTNKKNTAEVETSLHSVSSQFALYIDLEGYRNLTSGATRFFLQNKQEKAKDLEELLQNTTFRLAIYLK